MQATAMTYATESDEARVSEDEVTFMDRVLVSWSLWAWRTSSGLGYPECGNIWGLKKPGVDRRELILEDDRLLLVDRQVARLPWRTGRKVIFVEYFQHEPQGVKAKRFNLSVRSYRRRVMDLQQGLYNDLMPTIEAWKDEVL